MGIHSFPVIVAFFGDWLFNIFVLLTIACTLNESLSVGLLSTHIRQATGEAGHPKLH